MKICCIGAGYVGGPTMAMIAEKCPDIRVEVVDLNEKRVAAWNPTNCPSMSRGSTRSSAARAAGNLFFTTNVEGAIREADIIFVSVNTPTKTYGIGAGKAADLRYIESAARMIAAVLRRAEDHRREKARSP